MAKAESQYADIIRQNISEGRVRQPEITLALLKAAMAEKAAEGEVQVFLIDGMHGFGTSTLKTRKLLLLTLHRLSTENEPGAAL